ncbi:hypothetical protein [Stutzerimonas stutzeri]|uniref:Uncharacterized protein n=1 Tax=Stutzerimonas stutzeri TaxID=316 RepID=A0A6I6LF20_STUST|nr:hypothetical protein [Stutzerimonas stutzeri]QGZ28878.1 hypothetical protein GQA94_01900 [Stutzerimonas stutzeri]
MLTAVRTKPAYARSGLAVAVASLSPLTLAASIDDSSAFGQGHRTRLDQFPQSETEHQERSFRECRRDRTPDVRRGASITSTTDSPALAMPRNSMTFTASVSFNLQPVQPQTADLRLMMKTT